MRNDRLTALGLTLLALCFSVGVPLAATLSFFPFWRSAGGGRVLSGLCLILLILCALPLWRLLRRAFRTVSAPLVWAALFLLFLAVDAVAGQMKVITFAGTCGNAVGAVFFRLAKRRTHRKE